MQDSTVVWLLDDDASVRKALLRILQDAGFTMEAFDSAEALRDRAGSARLADIDVFLFDVRLPGDSGLQLWQSLRSRPDCPPVVFLSGNAQISEAVAAFKDGAADFLLKPFEPFSLLEAIERAKRQPRSGRVNSAWPAGQPPWMESLTHREREVMVLVGEGLRNAEIGECLGIGLRTVKMHRGNIMSKLGVRNQGQLLKEYFSSPNSSGP
jgi:FixJ family two-component response regulator